jgi:hypothetical protein
MEHIDGLPIVNPASGSTEEWNIFFSVAVESLRALEQVHLRTLDTLGLPPLPAPPHGMRGWQKRGMLDMETAVLGNGAFEVENIWCDSRGWTVVMDNEFAGWYPPCDHLTYLYHRLYCNAARPDSAKRLLRAYLQRSILPHERANSHLNDFYAEFARILKPRVLNGWYCDTIRRKLPPWHKKQRLRYRLLWHLLRGHYGQLDY